MQKDRHAHELIGAYLCDALDPEETRTVREHVRICDECRADLQSQSDLLSMIPDASDTLSEWEQERIRWSVARTVYRDSRQAALRVPFWKALRGLGIAVGVACVFAAGVFVGISHVGQATTAIKPNGFTHRMDAEKPAPPVKIRRNAPRSGQGPYVATLPEKATAPARNRRHGSLSSTGDNRRHHSKTIISPEPTVTFVHQAERPAPKTSVPQEPASSGTTKVAVLPPVASGSASLPMTGDDVRPIRLPVEGD